MMSPKWNDPDPGFVAMSQAFTLNPYRDAPFIPQSLMSPPIAYPEPLSPCLCADPQPGSVPEPKPEHESEHLSDREHEPEHDDQEDELEPEYEPGPVSQPFPSQDVKHEIAWSTIEAGLQGFASVRPSTPSSSSGYIDQYGCAHFSDTVDAVNTNETVQSFPYPFNANWNSQSHLPLVGDITMGTDGHIITQVAGSSGTAGYFSIFPTSYQPQSYQPSYGGDYFGTATTAAASYASSSYGSASFGSHAYGNAYANAYNSNPYNTTAYGHTSIQGTAGAHGGIEYPQQYNTYGEASQTPFSTSMPTSTMPAATLVTTMAGFDITASCMDTVSNDPVTPDCSLHHLHPSEHVRPGTPLRGDLSGRSTTFFRYVTPPFQTAGAPRYLLGEEQTSTVSVKHQPGHARSISSDSDSGRSRSSRSSSSSSSGASTAGYHRQTVLDSIPLHKLQAMQKIPLPAEGDNLAKDRYLVQGKQLKLSYGQIKAIADWPDAESTLRGRFRNFTKAKHERVRKPVWHDIDVGIPFISCLLTSHYLVELVTDNVYRNASSFESS